MSPGVDFGLGVWGVSGPAYEGVVRGWWERRQT